MFKVLDIFFVRVLRNYFKNYVWSTFVRKLRLIAIVLATVALVIFAQVFVASQVTTLDFEDLPAGTNVTTQYSRRGVLFPRGAFLDTDRAAHSGMRVLRAANPTTEFHQGPFVIQFTSGQSRVRLFAGRWFTEPANGTLRAFNAGGAVIAQDGPKPVAPRAFTTAFEVRSPTPSIMRIELEIGSADFESIDDLEFEGGAPAPPPTVAPVVQITSPVNNAQLDVSSINIQGAITGDGLLPTATLRLDSGRPPESTAPPFTSSVSLSGSSRTRTFEAPLGSLPLGPLTFTVEVENSAGLKGSAAVHLTNLPAPIRTRYASSGGTGAFGNFRWGGGEGGCRIAIYERGAISVEGATTQTVRGEIFNKWLSLRDPGAFIGRLGCPITGERDALGGAKAQDFRKGRIYATLPTGAYYVPSVFTQAIDQLGGETATGVPIADPRSSLGTETWLFQQFRRPGRPGLLSTLEISGSPPTLWMERQGGDLSTLSESGVSLTDNSPTIWQQFSCSGNQGPCNLSPPPPVGTTPPPGAGRLFCQGTTYPWGPPEWVAISGDYNLTPMIGIVKSSGMSGEDNPIAHEYYGDPPSFPSDWDIHVRPFPQFRRLFGDNTNALEVEVEYYFVQYFFVSTGFPNRGDLIFVSGRWIFDCGHSPYNTEIHPPSVMALMRTETYNGRPATVANIWVGGFYPGDPVDIDIFPPPRSSPDASLVVVKPLDSNAATDVKVEYSTPSLKHVRVRFTASPRRVPVTDNGEMKWQRGRGYQGRWYVYWSN